MHFKISLKSYRTIIKKAASYLLLVSFLAVNVAGPFDASAFAASDKASLKTPSFSLENLEIPAGLGHVEAVSKGLSGQSVILIQDAHSVPEAQESMRGILEFLESKGIRTVALEGASGDLDPLLFRAFPDKAVLAQVFREFAERGEISGAVLASVLNPDPAHYFGAENRAEYEKGVELFLKALSSRQILIEELGAMRSSLRSLQQEFYSPQALELERVLALFETEPQESLNALSAFAKQNPVSQERYPHLKAVFEIFENRAAQEGHAGLDTELRSLAQFCSREIHDPAVLAGFQEKFQDYQTEKIDAGAFALAMFRAASRAGIELSASENLKQEVRRREILESVRGDLFFDELQAYAQELKTGILKSGEEKFLDRIQSETSLLSKLLELHLSRRDWVEFGKIRSAVRVSVSDARLLDLQKAVSAEFLKISKTAPEFAAFYSNAAKREDSLLRNTLKKMTARREKNAVLVAGGFHAEGLMQALRKKGISYALVSPAISEMPEEDRYLGAMQGQVSWKSYFKARGGRVNLYEAFSRRAGERLTEVLAEQCAGRQVQPELKAWRDRVLTLLAAEKRVGQAGKYTRLIDSLYFTGADEAGKKKIREEWLGTVDGFLKHLKTLKTSNRLNAETVAGFNPSTAGRTILAWPATPVVLDASYPEKWIGEAADSAPVYQKKSEVRRLPGRSLRLERYEGAGFSNMPDTRLYEASNVSEAGDLLAAEILRELQIKQKELGAGKDVVVHFATGNTPWIGYTKLAELLDNWDGGETQDFLARYGLDRSFKPDMGRVIAFPLDALFPQKRGDYHAFANILNNMFERLHIPANKRFFFYGDVKDAKGRPLSNVAYQELWLDIQHNGLLIDLYMQNRTDRPLLASLFKAHPRQLAYLDALFAYSEKMSQKIEELGGAHIFISGVGPSYAGKGHIGFMESNTPFGDGLLLGLVGYHMAADHMKEDGGMASLYGDNGQKKFGFVTFGFSELLRRKGVKVITIATGTQKAESVRRGVEGKYTPAYPISRLQKERGVLILDRTSASSLRFNTNPWDFEKISWTEALVSRFFIQLSKETGKQIGDLTRDDFLKGVGAEDESVAAARKTNLENLLKRGSWNELRKKAAISVRSNLILSADVSTRLGLKPGSKITVVNPHLDDEYLAMRDILQQLAGEGHKISVYYTAKGYTAVHSAHAFAALEKIASFTPGEFEELTAGIDVSEAGAQKFAEAEEYYLTQLARIAENGQDLHRNPDNYNVWNEMSDAEQVLRAKLLFLRLNQRMQGKLKSDKQVRGLIEALKISDSTRPRWGSRDLEIMQDIKVFLRFNEAQTALMSLGIRYEDIHYPFDATWYGPVRAGTANVSDIAKIENALRAERPDLVIGNGEHFADFQAHSTTEVATAAALQNLRGEGLNPKLLYYRGVWDRTATTGGRSQISVLFTSNELGRADRLFRQHYPSQSPPPVPDSSLTSSEHFSAEVTANAQKTKNEIQGLVGPLESEVDGVLNFDFIPNPGAAGARKAHQAFISELDKVRSAVKRASGESVNGPVPAANLQGAAGRRVLTVLRKAGLKLEDVFSEADVQRTKISARSELRVPAEVSAGIMGLGLRVFSARGGKAAAPSARSEVRDWVKQNTPALEDYTVVNRTMEAGLHRGVLNRLPPGVSKYIAQLTMTGGLGALEHDYPDAVTKNGMDTISINPLYYYKIKGVVHDLPDDIKTGKKEIGDYLRDALTPTGIKFDLSLKMGEDFRRQAKAEKSKASEVFDKHLKVEVLETRSEAGGTPLYYMDVYYEVEIPGSNGQTRKVRVFDEVYPDDEMWRDVHMAVSGQASQILVKVLQERGIVKKNLAFVDNEVFVSLPTPMFPDAIHMHVNHTVFRPGLYRPRAVSWEMLGLPPVLKNMKGIIADGKINLTEVVAWFSDIIIGVSQDHGRVLGEDIFAAYLNKLTNFNRGSIRNTNGALQEQWQAEEKRRLINQYKSLLGIPDAIDDVFFKKLDEHPELLDEFQKRAEYINAVYQILILKWMKEDQKNSAWIDDLVSRISEIAPDAADALMHFEMAVRKAVQDPSQWDRLINHWPEAEAIKNALLARPIVANVRRQVPYKGPEKWLELMLKNSMLEAMQAAGKDETLKLLERALWEDPNRRPQKFWKGVNPGTDGKQFDVPAENAFPNPAEDLYIQWGGAWELYDPQKHGPFIKGYASYDNMPEKQQLEALIRRVRESSGDEWIKILARTTRKLKTWHGHEEPFLPVFLLARAVVHSWVFEGLRERMKTTEAMRDLRESRTREILGGREFDYAAVANFNMIKSLITTFGLEQQFAGIQNYNIQDARLIFQAMAATVMMSDEDLEASATSMMKALWNMGALIGVWDGAMPELFNIVEESTGKTISVFTDGEDGKRVTYDELIKHLDASPEDEARGIKKWKITNGFLVRYLPLEEEKSTVEGGKRRPSAKSLREALKWLEAAYADPVMRRKIQHEALKSSVKVDMEQGQARAHLFLLNQVIEKRKADRELFGATRVSLDDARRFVSGGEGDTGFGFTEKVYDGGAQVERTVLRSKPGLLSFVETARELILKGRTAYGIIGFHAQNASGHTYGDIFNHILFTLLKDTGPGLADFKTRIEELADQAALSSDPLEKVRLNLQALDLLDKLAQKTSLDLLNHIKEADFSQHASIEPLIRNRLVSQNLERYLDRRGVPLDSTSEGVKIYAVELDGEKVIIGVNAEAFAYRMERGPEAQAGISPSGVAEVIGREALNAPGKLYVQDVLTGENHGTRETAEVRTQGLFMRIPGNINVQVLRLGLAVEQKMISYLAAAVKGEYVDGGSNPVVLLQQEIRRLRHNPAQLRIALEGVARLSPAEARDKFGVEGVPPVMTFLAGLVPELLPFIENWHSDTFKVLKAIFSRPGVQEVFQNGEIWFPRIDRNTAMVFSRDLPDGRKIAVMIHFDRKFFSDSDGKVWVRVSDLKTVGVEKDNRRYYVFDHVLNRDYRRGEELPPTGAEWHENKWAVGIPVIPGKVDNNGITQPGFMRSQILEFVPMAAEEAPAPESRPEPQPPSQKSSVMPSGRPVWSREKRHLIPSLTIASLRRSEKDPGIGKFTDFTYDNIARESGDHSHVLPHHGIPPWAQSPYSSIDGYSLYELNIDWSVVEDVTSHPDQASLQAKLIAPAEKHTKVDHLDVWRREREVAFAAAERFQAQTGSRKDAFNRFVTEHDKHWLNDYAELMTLLEFIWKELPEWGNPDAIASYFSRWMDEHKTELAEAEDMKQLMSGMSKSFASWNDGDRAAFVRAPEVVSKFIEANHEFLKDKQALVILLMQLSRPSFDGWSERDREFVSKKLEAVVRKRPDFEKAVQMHKYAQWVAYTQFEPRVVDFEKRGGRVAFDRPMFAGVTSVYSWKHPEYFYPGNPGIVRRSPDPAADLNEDWGDLRKWNWSKMRELNYEPMLAPARFWARFGNPKPGKRLMRFDALHLAWNNGNGQLASGDEWGEHYVEAVSRFVKETKVVAFSEGYEGRAATIGAFGIIPLPDGTYEVRWVRISDHDNEKADSPRFAMSGADFLASMGWNVFDPDTSAEKYIAFGIGQTQGPLYPFGGMKRIEEINGVRHSYWDYRIPDRRDPNYLNEVRYDMRPFVGHRLRVADAFSNGDIWGAFARESLTALMAHSTDAFVRSYPEGVTDIWAAAPPSRWFHEPWGRDTFISAVGILMSTGRYEEARKVISNFASFETGGIIPNRIWVRDKGTAEYVQDLLRQRKEALERRDADRLKWIDEELERKGFEYNNADGSMWFIRSIEKYVEYSNDWAFAEQMRPVIERIIDAYSRPSDQATAIYHRHGKRFEIYSDSDNLTVQPPQSSWMDAQPHNRPPVTPRNGKTVEGSALKYYAIRFLERLETRAGRSADAARYSALGDKVRDSFNEKFWNKAYDTDPTVTPLFDVIDGDPHFAAIRPNMLWAVRGDLLLPKHAPADSARAAEELKRRKKAVFDTAARDLWTPYGPRTLSPRDSYYKPNYSERQARAEHTHDNTEKDEAYHQGPVWPWQIGPYIDALRETWTGSPEDLKAEIRRLLTPIMEYWMTDPTPGIPEIFDAGGRQEVVDEQSGQVRPNASYVQRPGGTPKQAWSEAEVLRVLVENGIIDREQLVGWSKAIAKPYRVQIENYTDKPVSVTPGLPHKIRAKVFIREDIPSDQLTVQVWTHRNSLKEWGQQWPGYFITMHPVGKTEDGLAYIFETDVTLPEGQFEYKVRATAGLANEAWFWDWAWSDGYNMKLQSGARSDLRGYDHRFLRHSESGPESGEKRSEMRVVSGSVLESLASGKPLDSKTAGEVAKLEVSPRSGEFENTVRAQAEETPYVEAYGARVLAQPAGASQLQAFLGRHPQYANDLGKFFSVKTAQISEHANNALLANPKTKLRFAFAIPLPESPETRQRVLDYVRMVAALRREYPSRVQGEIEVLIPENRSTDSSLIDFRKELGASGVAKAVEVNAQNTSYKVQDFLGRNGNGLAYGMDGLDLPGNVRKRMVQSSSEVSTDTVLSIAMLLSYELSGVQGGIGEELLRQIPDFLPGTRYTANGLEITHSAMELAYHDYQVGALLATMA